MKYSLISDMHINHPQMKTPYDLLEEVVVVAGDTSNGLDGMKFLDKLRRKGHVVLACDGNHEHYSNDSQCRTIQETTEAFRREHKDHHTFNGMYDFILRNGWYYVEDEKTWLDYMNDGRYAGRKAEIEKQADLDVSFVRTSLLKTRGEGRKAVVVTHTSPSYETLDRRYAGHYSNDWYVNPKMGELLLEFNDVIAVWNHGHTHAPCDKVVDGVRIVCNPLGYPHENLLWKPLTISLEIQ